MIKTLTDRFVAGARPSRRITNVFDTKARGLVLRVGSRTKVWYFTYRNGGATQWLRLGDYSAITLAEARAQAVNQRKMLDVDGIDPVEERRKIPTEPEPEPRVFTFKDFVPMFIAFQKGRT